MEAADAGNRSMKRGLVARQQRRVVGAGIANVSTQRADAFDRISVRRNRIDVKRKGSEASEVAGVSVRDQAHRPAAFVQTSRQRQQAAFRTGQCVEFRLEQRDRARC